MDYGQIVLPETPDFSKWHQLSHRNFSLPTGRAATALYGFLSKLSDALAGRLSFFFICWLICFGGLHVFDVDGSTPCRDRDFPSLSLDKALSRHHEKAMLTL